MSSRPEGIVFIDLHATTNTQDRPARYGATAFPDRAEIVQLSGKSKMQILFFIIGSQGLQSRAGHLGSGPRGGANRVGYLESGQAFFGHSLKNSR